jgi:hypothetical protein
MQQSPQPVPALPPYSLRRKEGRRMRRRKRRRRTLKRRLRP